MEKIIVDIILALPIIGGALSYSIGQKNEKIRDYFNIFLSVIVFSLLICLYPIVNKEILYVEYPNFMGIGLFIKISFIRYVLMTMTAFIWVLATIYSTQYLIKYKNRNRYYTFFIWTLGAVIGVFASNHFVNLLMFFEMMSLNSYVLVIHDEDKNAMEAGRTYLAMAIGGGVSLLMGLFLIYNRIGMLNLDEIAQSSVQVTSDVYIAIILIILGFGVKAGMFPLHIWLPKAHAAAPSPSSAILSGILVKTGVFGIYTILNVFMLHDSYIQKTILVLGFITMLLGGILGIFQINAKRILAYSTLSQMGYLLIGIALIGLLEENSIAVAGTMMHIINHILFKVLLFLCIGVIYMMTHELNINKIRGMGKNSLLLGVFFAIGFLGLSGIPGFNGYISKTILHEALTLYHHQTHSFYVVIAEYLFNFGGALTIAYSLKLFIVLFIDNEKQHFEFMHKLFNYKAITPLLILSLIIIAIGVFPKFILNNLISKIVKIDGHKEMFHFFSKESLLSVFNTMLIGIAIYIIVVRKIMIKFDGQNKKYVTIPKLFCLENSFYIPILKSCFITFYKIFYTIDCTIVSFFKYIMSLNEVNEINTKTNGEVILKSLPTIRGDNELEKIKKNIRTKVINKNFSILSKIKLKNKIQSVNLSIYIFVATTIIIMAIVLIAIL